MQNLVPRSEVAAAPNAAGTATAATATAAAPAVAPAPPVAAPAATVDLADPSLYINRQISWLAFNERVLDQALSTNWPLLERVKFLSIYFSNLDEFFMIRVSGLHEQLESGAVELSPDGLTAKQQLTQISQIARRHLEAASKLLSAELLPALTEQGVHLRDWKSLDTDTRRAARTYFRKSVFPVLTPLAVDPGHPFPFLSNLSLCLAVEARDPETKDRRFALVKVPEILPRFLPLASLDPDHPLPAATGSFQFLPLEQLIAANLDDLFPGMDILGWHPFRVTRDMDLAILEEEAHDLLSVVDREVRRRRFGACVRLEVDAGIPERVRRLLLEKLQIDEEDVYAASGPLGLAALMTIATLPRPDRRDAPFNPRVPDELADHTEVFAAIRRGDILLHHPYDSFSPVLDFLRRAADDPQVLAIKMTLYRAGTNSEAVRALIRAAENGKQVAVCIELKARFDEENNIAWARALEHAGAHVFYGDAVMKTHAKMVLVVRREGEGVQRYVHLATGNYNAGTARIYTDLSLLTADPQLGDDASELFNSLSGFSKKSRYRKLAVAPIGLVDTLLAKIAEQAKLAREGKPAWIFAKLNSLVDGRVIQALYRASMAGVSIDLCVRGICCLRPGLPGVSENIRVFSIVGRFLEHERVFVFGAPGNQSCYLSSADWMPRNFQRRVEVLFPVESERLREQIRSEVIEPALGDTAGAYQMGADGVYTRRTPPPSEPPRLAQVETLERVGKSRGSRLS
jgi:polyphosphate kinase